MSHASEMQSTNILTSQNCFRPDKEEPEAGEAAAAAEKRASENEPCRLLNILKMLFHVRNFPKVYELMITNIDDRHYKCSSWLLTQIQFSFCLVDKQRSYYRTSQEFLHPSHHFVLNCHFVQEVVVWQLLVLQLGEVVCSSLLAGAPGQLFYQQP